jgi:hypothetical protein
MVRSLVEIEGIIRSITKRHSVNPEESSSVCLIFDRVFLVLNSIISQSCYHITVYIFTIIDTFSYSCFIIVRINIDLVLG